MKIYWLQLDEILFRTLLFKHFNLHFLTSIE